MKQQGQVCQASPAAFVETGHGSQAKQQVATPFIYTCSMSERALLIQVYFIAGRLIVMITEKKKFMVCYGLIAEQSRISFLVTHYRLEYNNR